MKDYGIKRNKGSVFKMAKVLQIIIAYTEEGTINNKNVNMLFLIPRITT